MKWWLLPKPVCRMSEKLRWRSTRLPAKPPQRMSGQTVLAQPQACPRVSECCGRRVWPWAYLTVWNGRNSLAEPDVHDHWRWQNVTSLNTNHLMSEPPLRMSEQMKRKQPRECLQQRVNRNPPVTSIAGRLTTYQNRSEESHLHHASPEESDCESDRGETL